MSNWIKSLRNAQVIKANKPKGEGWLTMRELIGKLPFGDNKTRQVVRQAVKEGKCKIFIGTQENTCGILCRQVWYNMDE